MVCLGNICRSPLAQGILERKSKENNTNIYVDSAGTAGWHVGSSPDSRSINIAKKNNIDISYQKARKFSTYDFKKFDKIFVMDTSNYRDLIRLCSNQKECNKIQLILKNIDPEKSLSVPDPYYGKENGFENIYRLLEKACSKIISEIEINE
jgi:protein-tyrosine phosphatase